MAAGRRVNRMGVCVREVTCSQLLVLFLSKLRDVNISWFLNMQRRDQWQRTNVMASYISTLPSWQSPVVPLETFGPSSTFSLDAKLTNTAHETLKRDNSLYGVDKKIIIRITTICLCHRIFEIRLLFAYYTWPLKDLDRGWQTAGFCNWL